MFRARSLKITMIMNLFCAIIFYFFTISLFRDANKYYNSSYYYWSSDVRDAIPKLIVLGIIFLIAGNVQVTMIIMAVVLKNVGKVCPDCERVFFSSVIMCPKCKTDLIHAKSVKEYLAIKPKIISKGTPNISNVSPMTGEQNKNKRFCAYCGKELSIGSAFCPHCGSKAN